MRAAEYNRKAYTAHTQLSFSLYIYIYIYIVNPGCPNSTTAVCCTAPSTVSHQEQDETMGVAQVAEGCARRPGLQGSAGLSINIKAPL